MSLNLTISKDCRLHPYQEIPSHIRYALKKWLTFDNPLYITNSQRGYGTYGIPQYITGVKELSNGLYVPRGFAPHLIQLLKSREVKFTLNDVHVALPPVNIPFLGKPRDYQEKAVQEMFKRRFGTLESLPGSGKTFMSIYLASLRKQPTTIVVHTKPLFNQWVSAIQQWTGIPEKEIGVITSTRKKFMGPRFTVAMVRTLLNCLDLVVPYTGNLIVDECHRTPATTFTKVVTAFNPKFMTGLSATQWRSDGLGRLIFWYLGDKVHQISEAELIRKGHVLEADIIWRDTDFDTILDASAQYATVIKELTEDADRNEMIADDVYNEYQFIKNSKHNRVLLVLSDRREHVEELQRLLLENGVHTEILLGGMGVTKQRRVVEDSMNGACKVIVSTSQLIGEGFDLPIISSLFLTTPIRFDGRLIQYMGRALRPAEGKKYAKVYDYRDINVGVLKASAKARARVYGLEEEDDDYDFRPY